MVVRLLGRRGGQALIACISICVASLLACALGEMYIRLTKPYETPDTIRERSLEYEATLFARHAFPQMAQRKHGTWQGPWAVEINERGYRGESFAISKPAGVVRIVVLGGSSAFDAGSDEAHSWPHLVHEQLQARGYKQVEIINAATPGHATWDSLGRLYSEIWIFEPDYIVVYHAWNDLKYFGWLTPEKSLLRGSRPPPTAQGSNLVDNPFMYYTGPLDRLLSHSQLYTRLRWRYQSWQLGAIGLEGLIRPGGTQQSPPSPNPYVGSYSPWGPRQFALNLRLIADAARDIGATPIFLTEARLVAASNSEADRQRIGYSSVNLSHEAIVRALAECDKAILAVAQEKGAPVLDLSRMFTGHSELFYDHVHTTPEGSAAIAKAVADFLAGVLDKPEQTQPLASTERL
jgi:GDSL-like Lipase/Acylhydrolase family